MVPVVFLVGIIGAAVVLYLIFFSGDSKQADLKLEMDFKKLRDDLDNDMIKLEKRVDDLEKLVKTQRQFIEDVVVGKIDEARLKDALRRTFDRA